MISGAIALPSIAIAISTAVSGGDGHADAADERTARESGEVASPPRSASRTAVRSGPTGLLPYSGCARIRVCTAAEGSVVPSTSPAASSRPRQCFSFAASASWCVLIFFVFVVNLRRTYAAPGRAAHCTVWMCRCSALS